MKINIAKSAGFCFGVKRALKIAREVTSSKKNVVMIGDIVHNEDVVKDIKNLGIKKIARLSTGKDKLLLIRAHGISLNIISKAKKLGYSIVDATCPMVKEIHRIARDGEKKGFKIIIIGDKKHDEVQGILGQLKTNVLVIDSLKNIPVSLVKKIKKARIVVQSTQNIEKVLHIVDKLKSLIKAVDFVNTICNPTKIKQKEIKKMPLENDVMIIIGSKTSANTKRLHQISRSLNKKSYWINSAEELKTSWFKNARSVGITAGASTPNYVTQKIISFIRKMK